MSDQKEIREYKSNSFSLLLHQKKYALEIYNALNNSNYEDQEVVEILEIEGAFKLTVRGDSEFIIGNDLNFYEHQSSVNPNMPLRLLIYAGLAYKEYIRNRKTYSRTLIKIPNPRFVVFYNDVSVKEDRFECRLSDAFEKCEGEPELELKVLCININPGYNEDIKDKSPALLGYMQYVEKVRRLSQSRDLKVAVEMAVDECIKEGILSDFFMRYRDMIILADPIDETLEKREMVARQEGIQEGIQQKAISVAEKMLMEGDSVEKIVRMTGLSLEVVREMAGRIKVMS